MSDYDYGNARLRAMKSRLLTRRELEALAGIESVPGLVSALAKTAYQPSIELALTRVVGVEVVYLALRYDLLQNIGKVRSFFQHEAGERVAWLLRSYDIHNLKAVFRGLAKHAPTAEILTTLLPIGELSDRLLAEFARASNPRAVIDMLATLRLAYAKPLIALRAEQPGADTIEMELALDRWFYQEIGLFLEEDKSQEGEALCEAVALDADIVNLLTVLRFAHTPAERKVLRAQAYGDGISHLLVGPGKLSFQLLERVANQDTVGEAIKLLEASPYSVPLQAGLSAFEKSGRLSEVERQLKHHRLVHMAQMIRADPLGSGVLLGYLELKVNEISNLRWITQGVYNGLKPEAILNELELVS